MSMHDETVYADRLFAQGASGYIMKQAAADQLVTALRAVLRGERFVSDNLKRHLAERGVDDSNHASKLSARELQVISLIGQGLGTREIADRLSLSVKTVETHRPGHQAQALARYQLATGAIRDQMAQPVAG